MKIDTDITNNIPGILRGPGTPAAPPLTYPTTSRAPPTAFRAPPTATEREAAAHHVWSESAQNMDFQRITENLKNHPWWLAAEELGRRLEEVGRWWGRSAGAAGVPGPRDKSGMLLVMSVSIFMSP